MGSSMLPVQQAEEQLGITAATGSGAGPPNPEAEPGEGEAVRKQHQRGTSSAVFVTWEQVRISACECVPARACLCVCAPACMQAQGRIPEA